jgi:prephenate dehydratase
VFDGDLQSGRKTSVVCRLANLPGALYRALEPFASRGLNLTRIESRPVRDTPFAYEFHLDVGPTSAPHVLGEALRELRDRAVSVRVVGQYAPA